MQIESAAVLFLIFNRPDLTRHTFERIRMARPRKLFIASDGPRAGYPGEEDLCRDAREATYAIDWECEVHRLDRETNLGCKLAVSSAITWFFNHVEEGIILEDDCLPDLSFFRFCSELLEHYRNNHSIGIISGDNFQLKPGQDSYYLSKYPHIWGWATWRRFWQHYDVELSAWNGDPNSISPYLQHRRVRKHFAKRFDAVKYGNKDTWDFQLAHLCFQLRAHCINPSNNLVANVGFDERGTHTRTKGDSLTPPACKMEFPLRHPESIEIDGCADRYTETHVLKIQVPRLFRYFIDL